MRVYIKKFVQSTSVAYALVTIGLLLGGCATKTNQKSVKPFEGLSLPDTDVTLMPGDEIEVKFFYTPDLNEEQRIRPDGKITLQLVGEITAAGLKPAQLQKVLELKYTGLVERPSATVIPRELSQRKVFIGGAVNQPGLLEMPGNMTALGAIMESGSFNMEEADLTNILVLRYDEGEARSFQLDMRDALHGGTPHTPFYLHAQDVVFVQRTGVVRTAQWIRQYINQMVPQFGFNYFYNTGTASSTIGLDTTSYRR